MELVRLALYFDSDSSPWTVDKHWEDLLPSEWSQVLVSWVKLSSEHVFKTDSGFLCGGLCNTCFRFLNFQKRMVHV